MSTHEYANELALDICFDILKMRSCALYVMNEMICVMCTLW